jgi:hypothetical protein
MLNLALSAACLLLSCQVERHTGQQYFKRMSLRECLKVSVDRCAIFFRKVCWLQSAMFAVL